MKRFVSMLAAIVLFASATLAEGTEDYGYQKVQRENDARHGVYAQLENHDAPFDTTSPAALATTVGVRFP